MDRSDDSRDTDETLALRAALRECQETYRNTMDAALVGIYVIQDLMFRYVNPTMARLFGYEVAELENRLGPADLVVPEERARVRANLLRRAAGEPGLPYELVCLQKDGSTFVGQVWGKATHYHGHEASVGTLVDVTERVESRNALLRHREQLEQQVTEQTAALREANRRLELDIETRRQVEARLRKSEKSLRALINSTNEDAVVLLDADQRFVIANERAAKSLKHPVDDLMGRELTEVIAGEIGVRRLARIREVLATGRPARFEDQRDGIWYDNNVCAVLDDQHHPQGVAIFARDITGRKAMEQALARAKEDAERANLAKSRFLAAANHDLRQPLQAMTLLLEALGFSPLDDRGRRILGDMKDTLGIMEALLNALLDVSKLEAGTVVPAIQDFPVLPFLNRMRGQFKTTADDRGVRIRLFPHDAVLRTDPALLARIVQNFIANALRHTRGDRILIGCRSAGTARVRIEVWDRGEGIPGDQIERIFEDFYQLGNPARNRHQGLGLGLAIAKRVAGLLDLRLRVRSRPGRGSVFSVEVPVGNCVTPQPEAPETHAPEVQTRCETILILEDDETVLNATASLLRAWGYRPLCAMDAEQALALLSNPDLRPVVALVDYRLPQGENGIQFLRSLPARIGRRIPGILITGDTAPETLREAQASGFPLLHKPVDTARLRELILDRQP